MNKGANITVRNAIQSDCLVLSQLLNEIIIDGGTTAKESTITPPEFYDSFLNGPDVICCLVAVGQNGELLGFQSLTTNPELDNDCADIATFARMKPKVSGVGTTLFSQTLDYVKQSQFKSINATIRADNLSGLSYYSKMGFLDESIVKAVPLKDGTPVDRISKRFKVIER